MAREMSSFLDSSLSTSVLYRSSSALSSSSLALAFSTVITNSSGAALNRSRMSEIVSVRDVVDDDPREVNDEDG